MLNAENYETIRIERDGAVVIATLNRPERLNAVSRQMHGELERLPRDLDADPEVRALVITGEGRAFSSGGDFGGGPGGETPQQLSGVFYSARQLVSNWLDCEKPVISAVNGYAMGLGATVALLADVVFASKSAIFADTHVNMGIGAGDGGQLLWPLLIGFSRAKYYMMTGERLTGEEAERIGLVQFVTEDDELMPRALELAHRLANGPAYAISASKVGINQYLKMLASVIMPVSLGMEELSMTKEDHREAVQAFQEKRDPKYTGR